MHAASTKIKQHIVTLQEHWPPQQKSNQKSQLFPRMPHKAQYYVENKVGIFTL